MKFFTFSDTERPVRLSQKTREFALESLEHKYGLDTQKVPAAIIDETIDFDSKSAFEKYNICISEIVKQAPIRICDGERLSGAATLGQAMHHMVPATYKGKIPYWSVSHLTINFTHVLTCGVNGIQKQVEERLTDDTLTDFQKDFLHSALHCISAMRYWHKRYSDALSGMPEYAANYQNLLQVPFLPARSFYEAVQSVWFIFAFTRLCGNWPGIGRLDAMLGAYLKKDLEDGSITLEEAREILAHFFIKGCEWIKGGDHGSGDSQHYQNIVIGGTDENGCEVTNEVTYLILDILEEFNISDFPTTVRFHKSSPEKLLVRVAEVMKHGGGTLAVYNEETVIDAFSAVGYPLSEARSFANDGCWEMQVPGKTNFSYYPFDGLGILLNETLENTEYASFKELKEAYFFHLDSTITHLFEQGFHPDGTPRFFAFTPATVISLFEEGCIEHATDYNLGGATYYVRSPHLGGAADIGNSLRVIDKLCFTDKTVSYPDFIKILRNNWEGEEVLRQYILNKITKYGNDDDQADTYTKEVVDRFADLVFKHKTAKNVFFVPGISTFGRQIDWAPNRSATPHGHKSGEVLAPNMSATPGSDVKGATALICSFCKLDHTKLTSGAALDVKLLPSAVKGQDGTMVLASLIRGFVALGGCFMQPDIVDNAILLEAQKHPENYQSLSVRVSGWNARFVTMNKQWQDMCIAKTTHGTI